MQVMAEVGTKPLIGDQTMLCPGFSSSLGAAAVAVAPDQLNQTEFAAAFGTTTRTKDVAELAASRVVLDVPHEMEACVGVPLIIAGTGLFDPFR